MNATLLHVAVSVNFAKGSFTELRKKIHTLVDVHSIPAFLKRIQTCYAFTYSIESLILSQMT